MSGFKNILKRIFWRLPLPMSFKRSIRNKLSKNKEPEQRNFSFSSKQRSSDSYLESYVEQIINLPVYKSNDYIEYKQHDHIYGKSKIIAYYLTQFHPTEKNNLWWGKGTTEWTNVTKAVPQFVGHIQPKLPGDLGFYDLRLIDNMMEQVKIAKNYGVDGFCFYFYWFNGERALEIPLNLFLQTPSLDIGFSICWCNEDWTKRYSGINNEVLMSVGTTTESYKRFIDDAIPLFLDKRYIKVNGRPILSIYRPSQVPDSKNILSYWRKRVKEKTGLELYLIASQEALIDIDWTARGYDAISQFQPASIADKSPRLKEINAIRSDFNGQIYDYSKIVNDNIGIKTIKYKKVYPAVMPSWDNTSRRNQHATIYYNATPSDYKKWLKQAILYSTNNRNTEESFVFVNAWNEWGEGAYLEPDRFNGYAFLEATYEARKEIENDARNIEND